MILYEGSSQLTGDPIVVIATGTQTPSSNRKTGAMVQTWIMRSDIDPVTANKTGADEAICGDCKLRNGSCYEILFQAPQSIYNNYKNGLYERRSVKNAVRNRCVRIGAYGDSAAIPEELTLELVSHSNGHTNYTHQWQHATHLKEYTVASVNSVDEYNIAKEQGWQTFRVRSPESALLEHEKPCPYPTLQCLDCLKCDGKNHDISTPFHGAPWKLKRYETIYPSNRERKPYKEQPVLLYL